MENEHFIAYSGKGEALPRYDEEVLMTQIRVWAHWLDKELQISPSHVKEDRLEHLSLRIRLYQERFGAGKPDLEWAKGIEEMYRRALHMRDGFSYDWREREALNIPEDEFDKLLTTRRSIRNFTGEDVPDDLIRKLLIYGNWAPTNCNQQSLRYIVVKSREIKDRLTLGGLSGSMSPCLVVVIADMRFYSDGDIECPVHDSAAAIQNMLLASHYYGLGACYTSSLITNSPQNRRMLGVEDYEKITAAILLGHYMRAPPAPARRRIDEIIRHV